jgi:hypothetical protein
MLLKQVNSPLKKLFPVGGVKKVYMDEKPSYNLVPLLNAEALKA